MQQDHPGSIITKRENRLKAGKVDKQMKNKRLTIQRIDRFIQDFSLTESVNGYAEQQKQHAIACLNNYCRELEYQGRKSVKIKGATNGSENLEHDGRTSH